MALDTDMDMGWLVGRSYKDMWEMGWLHERCLAVLGTLRWIDWDKSHATRYNAI